MDNTKIVDYALNFLLANIDETTEEDLGMTTEEIEKGIEDEKVKTSSRGVVYLYYGGEQDDEIIEVSNQAEANRIAMEHGAEHWDYVER